MVSGPFPPSDCRTEQYLPNWITYWQIIHSLEGLLRVFLRTPAYLNLGTPALVTVATAHTIVLWSWANLWYVTLLSWRYYFLADLDDVCYEFPIGHFIFWYKFSNKYLNVPIMIGALVILSRWKWNIFYFNPMSFPLPQRFHTKIFLGHWPTWTRKYLYDKLFFRVV